ncbi:MAG TPA: adenylate/guanylate cyclase domain-containing protein [Terriglobales bacterium]|nr:adenylate/guanylate cyclase domain-containing protein [Terriglobales bacterium]
MIGGERRLAAIMFTDVVGYSRLTQTNEPLALELLEEHRGILRPIFTNHGGAEVKTIGDAFLVEFKSALDAVLCAVDLQKSLKERNDTVSPLRRLEMRIGIHLGDVIHTQNDVYGDAVNLASRIEPIADPGGICISQQVYDHIRSNTSLQIKKVGDVNLKNIELPVGVYNVITTEDKPREVVPRRQKERLAVLPFVNITPNPNDEYFADGLTEELISKLSEIVGLKVIARTSVMSYKHKDKKVSEIGKELDVDWVIEGSVRKAGNLVRITVQLVDPETEEHIWASNYDSKLDDIFAIQSDVASKVAASLSAGFFSQLHRRDTEDVEAYTLYLRALQLSYDTSEHSTRETVTLLERAVSRDPRFARAYAALSGAWQTLAVNGYEEFSAMAKNAEVAAEKALELDPSLAEAHSAMAQAHSMFDRFDSALQEAEAAIRINPNLSDAYVALGTLNAILRTPEEALAKFKRAYELDPLSQGTSELVSSFAQWIGDEDLARSVLARLKEINPNEPRTYLYIADYHMYKREFDEAQRMIDQARLLGPNESLVDVSQALLFAFSGKRTEAEEALKHVLDGSEASMLLAQLWVQAALGNLDKVFDVLMQMARNHSWPSTIRSDPLYAKMRKDTRYLEFCKNVGIIA